MILVDVNLLLYAEDSRSRHHRAALDWWVEQLSGSSPVALCWPVISGFVRIGTNPRLLDRPLSLAEAIGRVESWFRQPCVRVVTETKKHWEVWSGLMEEADASANLVPDAHLAALAIENGCTLCSSDRDFARFKGLRWLNPLA